MACDVLLHSNAACADGINKATEAKFPRLMGVVWYNMAKQWRIRLTRLAEHQIQLPCPYGRVVSVTTMGS
eukprot:5857500-Pyramimonas_sp.AAC.1